MASLVAPLSVVLPLILVAYFMISVSDLQLGPHISSPLFAVLAAVQFYPLFVGLFLLLGFLLRLANGLSRKNLLVSLAALSMAVALWLGCDWEASCATLDSTFGVGLQFAVCFLLLSGIALVWWHIAAKAAASNMQVPAHGSEA